jgi:hypothetical protein
MHASFAAAVKQCQEEVVTSSDAPHPGNSAGNSPEFLGHKEGRQIACELP